eukprot:6195849-Pleurochrysis_carterae.AAC.2
MVKCMSPVFNTEHRVCRSVGYGNCDRETPRSTDHNEDVVKFRVERPRHHLVIDINRVKGMRRFREGMAAPWSGEAVVRALQTSHRFTSSSQSPFMPSQRKS